MRAATWLIAFTIVLTAAKAGAQTPLLRINEVMPSNTSTHADEDGDYEDWIEIANLGPMPINLNGHGLTDSPSNPFKWVFGNVVIQPSQFLVVFASNKNRALHTNFAISAGGETIVLTAPDGTSLDSVATGPMRVGISRGRAEGATIPWPFFDQPTPGQPNTTPWYLGFTEPPTISQPSGRYAAPLEITVTAAAPEHHVTLTLDGRSPMATDQTAGGVWPIAQTRVVRARAFRDGYIPSPVTTASYLINDPTTLPIVSLVTDPGSLFDPEHGLFSLGPNPGAAPYYPTANFRQDVELPIHVAMFEPDGTTAFELDAGMELQGGISLVFPKKSLRIEAKASYGADAIEYQVFPDKPVNSFRHLLLRSSSEDQFETLFRDALGATLANVTTLDHQAYRPVVLFINEHYWGIYNLREVATEEYVADTYGYDEDEIDVIEFNGSYEVRAGTANHFMEMAAFVYHNDLSVPANYEVVKSMIDIENALDYFAFQIFIGNNDWPGNNIRYWRPRAAGGRWRFLLYDLDNGMRLNNLMHDTLAYATNDRPTGIQGAHNEPEHTFLLRALLRNSEFVTEFIRRLDDMGNIVFAPTRVATLIQQMAYGILDELPRQTDRWWTGLGLPFTMDTWFYEVMEMWTFGAWRPTVVNYFLANDFNLPGRSDLTVGVAGGSGGVRVNSQRAPSYPYWGTHVSLVPVRLTALPDPGYRFVRWSGAVESSEPQIMVDMTAARSVVAHFALDLPIE